MPFYNKSCYLASVILLIVTMLTVSLQNAILLSIIFQCHFAVCVVPPGTGQNDGSEKCHSNDCLGARTDPLWEKMKQSDVPLSLFHLTSNQENLFNFNYSFSGCSSSQISLQIDKKEAPRLNIPATLRRLTLYMNVFFYRNGLQRQHWWKNTRRR